MFARSIVLMALICGIAGAPGAAAAQEMRSCSVDEVKGQGARVWHQGVWADLRQGVRISTEVKIATGAGAQVRIACDDRSVVTIGVSTEVNLEHLVGPSGPGRSVILQLVRGIVGIFAPVRTWDRFEVRTPVAIASVRSTIWLVEHEAPDGSAVFVRAGEVAVGAIGGGQAVLGPGEGITIAPDGSAGEVKVWGAPRIARSMSALGFDWQ